MIYYNEFDPFAAEWLRELMKAGLIPHGEIDTRSITEVKPDDIRKYTQCHFFAGIGGWSEALRIAGWPTDRPVWTGSCPCQPFSSAGNQKGKADERHLWPVWFNLIRECRPPVIFGEQVASAINARGKTSQSMQDLWARKAIIELLQQEYFGENLLQMRLQTLRNSQKVGESSFRQGVISEAAKGLAQEQSRSVSESNGSNTLAQERYSLHHNGGVGAREDRSRSVRTDGYSVQSRCESELGQPVTGSDNSEQWIHDREYEGSFVFSERDDEQLGRTKNNRNGERYKRSASEKIRNAARKIRAEIEGTSAHGWLDDVYQGLEAEGYACGSAVLPACSVGAPHKRDRLFFVGNTEHHGPHGGSFAGSNGAAICNDPQGQNGTSEFEGTGEPCDVADAIDTGSQGHGRPGEEPIQEGRQGTERHPWESGVWINCPDGKQRLIEPGIPLLAHGVQNRVGKLRGYGNAIVPAVGAAFIQAFLEVENV